MQRIWIAAFLCLAACGADEGKKTLSNGAAGSFGNAESGTSADVGSSGSGTGSSGNGSVGAAGTSACEVGKQCAPQSPDDDNCGTLTLKGDAKMIEKPGNVLVIFDRSGSMMSDWNGTPRWQAGGTALIDALTPIADKLTIGAVLFPSPGDMAMPMQCAPNDYACMFGGFGGGGGFGATCDVNPITAVDQVNFKAGAEALMELQSGGTGGGAKYAPVMAGGTPTAEAVQVADMSFAGATLEGTTCAVIITDGDPTCNWNESATVATIAGWLKDKNIKTYVIGLPGSNNGDGEARLNALAAAGGTMSYIPPNDSVELQKKLNEIVSQTVSVGFDSCTIHLDPVAEVPEMLQLVDTDKGIEQSVPHVFAGQTKEAWTISDDGSTVELLDQLCTDVKGGRFSEIRFTFGCEDLPELPVPDLE